MRWPGWAAVATAVLLAAGGGYWFGGRQAAPPSGPPEPAAPALSDHVDLSEAAQRNFNLAVTPATRRPMTHVARAPGSVGFNEQRLAHINPLTRGRVQAVEVTVGDRVAAGQRLAVIDALDLAEARHQLSGAQAAVRQAKAEADAARAALGRAEVLVRGGALAQSEVDRRRATLAAADAAVTTRATEAEHWAEMLRRYDPTGPDLPGDDVFRLSAPTPSDARGAMLAPFAGVVMAVGATPGELVDTNREFFTLADLSVLWVYGDLPGAELAAVRPGAAMTLLVDAYPGRRFPGHVAHVADQLDPRTGTARVRCEVPNPDGALRINMFGTVEIEEPLGRDGVMLPEAAVQLVDGTPTVFLRETPERFARRVVRIGAREAGQVEVIEGLQGGELVVTQGSFQLKSALLRSRIEGD